MALDSAPTTAGPKPQSMGLRLIELLAGQIGGKVSWSSNGGTMFSLVLPRQ